jgi:cytochrome bd-type quinol oxidase subunit 2
MSNTRAAEPERRDDFFALPSTSMGRVSLNLLLAGVVAVVVNNVAVMPFTEGRQPALDSVQWVVNTVVASIVLVAGAAGAWALVRQHERSWLVVLAVVLALLVLALNIAGG